MSDQELDEISDYLATREKSSTSHPHEPSLSVFSLGEYPFAYFDNSKHLLRLSLRADNKLATLLKQEYEEVATGYKLDPDTWITIVLSGQLSVTEIKALIDHSYQLSQGLKSLE